MAAKKKPVRKVLSLNVYSFESSIVEEIESSPEVMSVLYRETYAAIKHAIDTKKKIATIFQISNSGAFIDILEEDYGNALERCIEYYSTMEDYTTCVEIKKLHSTLTVTV